MKTVSSSVTPELAEELRAYAAKYGLSVSTAIRGILEKWAICSGPTGTLSEESFPDNRKNRPKGFLERFFG